MQDLQNVRGWNSMDIDSTSCIVHISYNCGNLQSEGCRSTCNYQSTLEG